MRLALKLLATLVVAVGLLGAGVLLAVGPMSGLLDLDPEPKTEVIRDREVIKSLQREEQVVLLSLGIQGIEERKVSNEKLWGGFEIPGSGTVKFIQYGFKAKLGLEGKDIEIQQVAEDEYLVKVPEFSFIGHDDIELKLVAEQKGALSWIVPEKENLEIATEILNSSSQKQYVKQNRELLQDQTAAYYRQLVASIDPTISLDFEFAEE